MLPSAAIVALLIGLVGCMIIAALALLGPTIGTVFSNIVSELATPSS